MGNRSSFLELKNETDLLAAIFMCEAMSSVADYDTGFFISYICEKNNKYYAAVSHDGSTAFSYYSVFSPNFKNFITLENLCSQNQVDLKNRWIGSKILT